MNIEIANRLVELRKKSGLSQEELASKLGLSRQAVSKWERAEASPDTDNLIVLAQIYHVSLDDLLSTDTPVDEIVQDVKDQQEEKKEEPKAVESEKDDDACLTPNQKIVKAIVHGVFDFLGILSFLLVGFLWQGNQVYLGWKCGWTFLLFGEFLASISDAILKKKATSLNVVFLCVGLYCLICFILLDQGMNWFHPLWVIFLFIPAYYGIAGSIEKAMAAKEEASKTTDSTK